MNRLNKNSQTKKPLQRKNQYIAALCGNKNYLKGKKIHKKFILVCVGHISLGSSLAWTSPVLPQLIVHTNDINTSSSSLTLTDTQVAIVGSMLPLGALLVSIPAGYMADHIGRKFTIILSQLPFVFSWILLALAGHVWVLYIGRFIGGIGVGGASLLCSTYISETADIGIRGSLGALPATFLWLGVLITYTVGAIFSWRILTVVLNIFPALTIILVWSLPDTPVYLYRKCRIEDAKKVLLHFNGDNYDVANDLALLDKLDRERIIENISYGTLFSCIQYRRALIVAVLLMTLQQTCGVSITLSYTGLVFLAAGSSINLYTATILVAIVKLLFPSLVALIMEKEGRRFFMIISLLGMCFTLICMGIFFELKEHILLPVAIEILPVIALCLHCVFYCLGANTIPYIILGEIFTPAVKGLASGLTLIQHWLMVFLVTFSFPILNAWLGRSFSFYMYASLTAIGCVLVYFILPETRNKNISEVQEVLKKRYK